MKKRYYKNLLLKIILSFQLGFSPYYAYTNEPSSSPNDTNKANADPVQESIREAFRQFSEQGSANPFQSSLEEQEKDLRLEGAKNPELDIGKKLDILNALSTAIDTGTLEKYLQEFPEVKNKSANIFLFADQKVESIAYHFDSEKNKIIEEKSTPINLNDYASHPTSVFFKKIKTKYIKESKQFVLEGIRTEVMDGKETELVVLRHRISNMDIIDHFADDQILVLVDKSKGLLIANMIFAEAYLGKAPIPFTHIPVPLLKNLRTQMEKDNNKGKVLVEFYTDKVQKPDTVPEYIDNIQKNLEGRTFITHGDLMISYIDSQEKKHLVQFLKRSELAGWMKVDYGVLDTMIKMLAPYIMSVEEIKLFEKKYESLDSREQSKYALATLFSRGSIQKLIQAKESISYIIDKQLETMANDKNTTHRQMDSLAQIKDNISEAVEDINRQTDESSQEAQKTPAKEQAQEPKNLSAISKALRAIYAVQNYRSTKNFIQGHTQSIRSFFKTKGMEIALTTIIISTGLYFFVKYLFYSDSFSFYSATTFPHLLIVGISLPIFLIASAKLAVPAAQLAYKKILPVNFMRNFIDKWQEKDWATKLTGFAIKFVSIGMLGFWIWAFRAIGKPHFFLAINKGLNPFETVRPSSDIGKVTGLQKDTTLGTSGWKWNKQSKDFTEQDHLLDVAQEKQNRIHFISWLMATLAIAKKTNMDPIDSLIYGVGRFDLKELVRMKTDHTLQMEFLWIVKNLEKEIKKLELMDIQKDLVNLDPKLIKEYYERAQAQVEKFHSQPALKKKFQSMVYTASRLVQQTPLINFKPRNLLTHNMDQVEKLSKVPSEFIKKRFLTEFFMDHLVVMTLPLVMTERADFSLNRFTTDLSMYTNKFLLTGEAHLQDVWLNVIQHFIIAGGHRAMQFSDEPSRVKELDKKYSQAYKTKAGKEYPIKEKKTNFVQELINVFRYLAITGTPAKEKAYPDNFTNFGESLWTEYKTRLKIWQITITLVVGMRLLLTDQTLGEAGFSFLLLNLLAGSVNGFWILLGRAHQFSENNVANNRTKMEKLRDTLYRINQGFYETEAELRSDYKEAVLEMIEIYKNPGYKNNLLESVAEKNPELFDYIHNKQAKDSFESLSSSQSLEKIKNTSKKFLELISSSAVLDTKNPDYARRLLAFTLGAVTTTFIAIELIVLTFNKSYLNWETVGITAGIIFSLYTSLYWAYHEKFKQWRKNITEKGFISKSPKWTKGWANYFYQTVLNVPKKAGGLCRQIFRKH